ncbi:MAG: TetR/AcrR family transcriptional regulator [Myxococcota bacterium]
MAKKGRKPGRPSGRAGPVIERSDLLEVAVRLIGERGFEGTSVRAIAAAAGVSHGTVQHHFPTKEDLWKAIVDEVVVKSGRRGPIASPPESMNEAVQARIEAAFSRPGFAGAVLHENTPDAAPRLEYLRDATRPLQEENRRRLEMAVRAGLLREVDVITLMILFSMGLSSIATAPAALRILFDVDLNDRDQRAALVAGVSDILLYGLLPRP